MKIENRILKTEAVRWRELRWVQGNLKSISKSSFERLKQSLLKNSFVQPFNVWDNGGLWCLDGHHRQRAMQELEKEGVGIPETLPANFIDCKDEREAKKLVLVYSSIYARTDEESLYEFIHVNELNFDDLKLEIDLPEINLGKFEAGWMRDELQEDEVPEVPVEPRTKRGDLYELGRHRLLCGDSTKAEDVARVMGGKKVDMVFTDPPYGINYDPQKMLMHGSDHPAPRASRGMANDDGSLDLSFLWLLPKRLVWGFPYLYDPSATGWLVWDKHPGLNGESIGNPVEIASTTLWSGFKIVRCLWGGYYRAAGEERGVHPTQKPLGVVAPYLEGASVFDPFLGSGTTLIAAEQLNRVCYGIEIDPLYCDVTVQRWVNLTKQTRIRCNDQEIDWPLTHTNSLPVIVRSWE